jgi:KaiC/GvpD/RAD55 family RecA-like ATPase
MKVSKSFVINADAVKAYDDAREFFLKRGYTEQSTIRPTLLVLKKREDAQKNPSLSGEYCRVSLRASFNPVGDLQLYSGSLLTVRCEYEVKCSGGAEAASNKATFETEVEQLQCCLTGQTFKEKSKRISNQLEPETQEISTVSLPNRISTGYEELNSMMLGGIPDKYAIILTSPSCDERDLLIKRFLDAGAKSGQITFYITGEPGNGAALAEAYPINFYLFVCNPRADVMVKSLPNVFKLKGVECLTDIDIALVKAFRMLDAAPNGPRRACVDITSDVLLQHRAVITRKWLSALLPDLKSKGFTTLAVINPHMHPQEEVHAILGLFDGEITISERETTKGREKTLRIKRLYNQQYLEDELVLSKEKLAI